MKKLGEQGESRSAIARQLTELNDAYTQSHKNMLALHEALAEVSNALECKKGMPESCQQLFEQAETLITRLLQPGESGSLPALQTTSRTQKRFHPIARLSAWCFAQLRAWANGD